MSLKNASLLLTQVASSAKRFRSKNKSNCEETTEKTMTTSTRALSYFFVSLNSIKTTKTSQFAKVYRTEMHSVYRQKRVAPEKSINGKRTHESLHPSVQTHSCNSRRKCSDQRQGDAPLRALYPPAILGVLSFIGIRFSCQRSYQMSDRIDES